jgi:hypothetical protein
MSEDELLIDMKQGLNFIAIISGEDVTSTALENHTKQTIREALAAHQPPSLPENCDQRLDEIIHG